MKKIRYFCIMVVALMAVTTIVPCALGAPGVSDFRIIATPFVGSTTVQWDGKTGLFLGAFTPSQDRFHGLKNPDSIVTGPDGNIYIAWSGDRHQEPAVHVYAPDGTALGEFASLAGLSAFSVDWLTGLSFGPDGELYVLDKGNVFGTAEVFRFEGPTSANPGAFLDIYIDPVDYERPDRRMVAYDVETGPDGNLYFPSVGLHEILRFATPSGEDFGFFAEVFASAFDVTWPPLGVCNRCVSNSGWIVDEVVPRPLGLAWGDDGLFYVSANMMGSAFDTGRIARFDANGHYIDDFVPLSQGLDRVLRDIDFGPDGDLYVASKEANEILVLGGPAGPMAGQLIRTLAVPNGFDFVGPTSITFVIDGPIDPLPSGVGP